MFTKRPFIITDYRMHRIEIRLTHHPNGVISDLQIFKKGGDIPCIVRRPDRVYLDTGDASKELTSCALSLIDQFLLENQQVDG